MEAGGTNQSGNNEALLSLESALLTACETLSGLASLAVDFQYDSQDLLFAKVNELVRDLDTIDERAHETTQTVPLDVLDAIDRGRNPEHTTLQVLESCSDANNITLGKLNVMAHFRFVYRLVHLFLRSDTNDTGYVSDELDKKITEAGIQLDDKAVVLAEVNEALEKTGTASNSETMQ